MHAKSVSRHMRVLNIGGVLLLAFINIITEEHRRRRVGAGGAQAPPIIW